MRVTRKFWGEFRVKLGGMGCGLTVAVALLFAPAEIVAGAPDPVTGALQARILPAMTPVDIEIADPLNSKTNKSGDMFRIRLVQPITVDGHILVASGSEGRGEVVHAAKAGAAGKAGELILAARYLEQGGVRIPLRSFKYGPATGKSNVDAAAATGVFVGPLHFLIGGGQVDIPAGTRANARVAADISLPDVRSLATGLTAGEVRQ